jgi:epoxide hydrolase-like predicted phosphatase
VLVDFAGTLTEDIRPAFLELAAASGAEPEALTQMVLGGGPDTPWCRFERGEISLDDVVEWGRVEGAARGWTLDFRPLVYGVISMPIRTGMVQRLRLLRNQGYLTALVTNNAKELATLWPTMFPVDELFDLVIDSSAVGTRKPERRIFEITLERLGIEAHQAVLFDDLELNLVAARQLGLQGVLVGADPTHAYAAMDRLLGCESPVRLH